MILAKQKPNLNKRKRKSMGKIYKRHHLCVLRSRGLFSSTGSFLGQQNRVNIRQHSTTGNRHTLKQFPQLVIIPHRKKHVPRDNPVLLVVTCGVPSQLQYLHCEITLKSFEQELIL